MNGGGRGIGQWVGIVVSRVSGDIRTVDIVHRFAERKLRVGRIAEVCSVTGIVSVGLLTMVAVVEVMR